MECFCRSERRLTARKSRNSPSPVCAGACERVHGYQTFPSLPGTQWYLHRAASRSVTVASWPMSTGVGLGADCVPRCPVVWGQAASVPYLHDPHASQDNASLIPRRCGSVMLIQLPSGRDTQLLCLVELFQIYCMIYLQVNTAHHNNEQCYFWQILLFIL